MYVTDKAEIVIDASSEDIWEYVTDPVHWTASNPEEHYGLEYDTPDNRPREGATFHQAEEVVGCTPTCMADSSISTIRWRSGRGRRTIRSFEDSSPFGFPKEGPSDSKRLKTGLGCHTPSGWTSRTTDGDGR